MSSFFLFSKESEQFLWMYYMIFSRYVTKDALQVIINKDKITMSDLSAALSVGEVLLAPLQRQ